MRIVIVATGSWGDVRPNAILGQALRKAGYEVVLVAAEAFRAWVEARDIAFAGLSVNMQAMLDGQTNSRNPLETMRWMRDMTQMTVQMGRELAAVIQPGDTVLLNEGLLGLVNGTLEKHKARAIHINMQPWVPTAAFSGMVAARLPWLPISDAAYNRWAGGLVRRGQYWAMGGKGNQIRTEFLGLPQQAWAKHRVMLDTTPPLLLVSPHVLLHPADLGLPSSYYGLCL